MEAATSFGELITLDYCNGWSTRKSRTFAVELRANFGRTLDRVKGSTLDPWSGGPPQIAGDGLDKQHSQGNRWAV